MTDDHYRGQMVPNRMEEPLRYARWQIAAFEEWRSGATGHPYGISRGLVYAMLAIEGILQELENLRDQRND